MSPVVSGSMIEVISGEDRVRLGEKIRKARADAGMTATAAAAHADMSPTTWGRIERGENVSVRPNTYAAIERVLGWEPGSIEIVLEGGDPTPATSAPGRRAAPPPPSVVAVDHITAWEQQIIDEIWAHPALSEDQKEELTARARARAAEARTLEDRLRRTA